MLIDVVIDHISRGDVVRVSSPHGRVELPAYVTDMLHPKAVAIPMGLGHTEYGRFARAVGQSPLGLLPGEPDPASGGPRWLSVRVTLEKTGRREKFATPAGVTEVDRFAHIYPRAHPGSKAPLGWTLSGTARRDLRGQLRYNRGEIAKVRRWFAGDLTCEERR